MITPLPIGPEDSCEAYRCVLGPDRISYEVPRLKGYEERFYVEGLSFPDAGFPGLLSFHITLLDDSNEVRLARQRVTQMTDVGMASDKGLTLPHDPSGHLHP